MSHWACLLHHPVFSLPLLHRATSPAFFSATTLLLPFDTIPSARLTHPRPKTPLLRRHLLNHTPTHVCRCVKTNEATWFILFSLPSLLSSFPPRLLLDTLLFHRFTSNLPLHRRLLSELSKLQFLNALLHLTFPPYLLHFHNIQLFSSSYELQSILQPALSHSHITALN